MAFSQPSRNRREGLISSLTRPSSASPHCGTERFHGNLRASLNNAEIGPLTLFKVSEYSCFFVANSLCPDIIAFVIIGGGKHCYIGLFQQLNKSRLHLAIRG